jgi:hypothetical protein
MDRCSKLSLIHIISWLDTQSVLFLACISKKFRNLLEKRVISFPPKGHFIDYSPNTHIYLLSPNIGRIDIRHDKSWKILNEVSHKMINYDNIFITKKCKGWVSIDLINTLIYDIANGLGHKNIQIYYPILLHLPYLETRFTLDIFGRPDVDSNLIIDLYWKKEQQLRVGCQLDSLPEDLFYLHKNLSRIINTK